MIIKRHVVFYDGDQHCFSLGQEQSRGRRKEYQPIRRRKGRVFAGAAQRSRLAHFSLLVPGDAGTAQRNVKEIEVRAEM